MGEVPAKLSGIRPRLAAAAVLLVTGLVLFWGAGVARAGGCTDNWNGTVNNDWFNSGNWSTGVPTNTDDACIPNGSFTVVINGQTEASTSAAVARSLAVGTGDTLELDAINVSGTQDAATLNLFNPSSVASTGEIEFTAGCTAGGCSTGAPSTLNIQGSTLTNDGTILSDPGTDSGSNARNFEGTLNNAGTISLGADLTVFGSGSQVTNASGGTITNAAGIGSLLMETHTIFDQAGGTTSPSTVNPTNPAVVMDNPTFLTYPTVSYTGSGASTVVVRGGSKLTGNLASGQNLVANGIAAGCGNETLVTATSDFSNAGTITLNGIGCSGLQFQGHTLTNTGTINAAHTGSGITREIKGSLVSSGTLSLLGDTAFDGTGASLSQTAGTTTLGPGKFLDLSGSNGTFELHGGLIQAPGSNHSNQSGITGNLNNTGGNVAPGSTTIAGDMAIVGHYTQGASGRLTSVVVGTSPGGTYSQLGVTQGSTLAGTLDIVTHPGSFFPRAGTLFTILGGSTRTGKFTNVIGEFPFRAVMGFKPLYQSNNVTLQATPRETLRVKLAGTKQGTVTSSPAGINCGAKCSSPFFKPQAVTLTEHPVSGHRFTGWSGACTGKTTTCKVTMTATKSVTATFS